MLCICPNDFGAAVGCNDSGRPSPHVNSAARLFVEFSRIGAFPSIRGAGACHEKTISGFERQSKICRHSVAHLDRRGGRTREPGGPHAA